MGDKASAMWWDLPDEQRDAMEGDSEAKEKAWDVEYKRRQSCLWEAS